MSHGGDGAGDPPRGTPATLPGLCEDAQPPRRRGVSRSANLNKIRKANKGAKLFIQFDYRYGTLQPVGKNQKYFSRLIGNQVRKHVPPYYRTWNCVPEEKRALIFPHLEVYFDIRGAVRTKVGYDRVKAAVQRTAADRYRGYKTAVHKYYKTCKEANENEPVPPYKGLSTDDWKKCLELFEHPEFKARSQKNQASRALLRYVSVQGSKTFIATRVDEGDPETQELPSLIDSFRKFHTCKNGNWVNDAAAVDYDRLCEARLTQQTQVASSGGSVDERAIQREVLGRRRGHECGVGRIPRGMVSSEAFAAASDGANGGPTSVEHDERLAQMQAEIQELRLLVSRLIQNTSSPPENEDTNHGRLAVRATGKKRRSSFGPPPENEDTNHGRLVVRAPGKKKRGSFGPPLENEDTNHGGLAVRATGKKKRSSFGPPLENEDTNHGGLAVRAPGKKRRSFFGPPQENEDTNHGRLVVRASGKKKRSSFRPPLENDDTNHGGLAVRAPGKKKRSSFGPPPENEDTNHGGLAVRAPVKKKRSFFGLLPENEDTNHGGLAVRAPVKKKRSSFSPLPENEDTNHGRLAVGAPGKKKRSSFGPPPENEDTNHGGLAVRAPRKKKRRSFG